MIVDVRIICGVAAPMDLVVIQAMCIITSAVAKNGFRWGSVFLQLRNTQLTLLFSQATFHTRLYNRLSNTAKDVGQPC